MPMLRRLALVTTIALLTLPVFSQTKSTTPELSSAATPAGLTKVLNASERKEFIRKAQLSYYSLKASGLAEFRFEAVPDWDVTFKDIKPDEIGKQQVLPILRNFHFLVLVGPDGASSVSHQSDDVPPSEDVAARIRKSTGGVDQMLTGFLHTWTGFAFAPLFPKIDSEYEVIDTGTEFRLTYKEGPTDVTTTLGRDFAIKEVKVKSTSMNVSLQPTWSSGKSGFVLTGYVGVIKTETGASQTITVTVQYAELEGLNLPSEFTAIVTLPDSSTSIHFPISFTKRTAKKR